MYPPKKNLRGFGKENNEEKTPHKRGAVRVCPSRLRTGFLFCYSDGGEASLKDTGHSMHGCLLTIFLELVSLGPRVPPQKKEKTTCSPRPQQRLPGQFFPLGPYLRSMRLTHTLFLWRQQKKKLIFKNSCFHVAWTLFAQWIPLLITFLCCQERTVYLWINAEWNSWQNLKCSLR